MKIHHDIQPLNLLKQVGDTGYFIVYNKVVHLRILKTTKIKRYKTFGVALTRPVLLSFTKGVHPISKVKVSYPTFFMNCWVMLYHISVNFGIKQLRPLSPKPTFNQFFMDLISSKVNQSYKINVIWVLLF